ncbi:MAG: 4Fe-4S dicluster domain-containing protein [Proteobacteria bacterium]|nr:4Fe-4S dicluster domain-containing protein [Pseudomonadota bacterium]
MLRKIRIALSAIFFFLITLLFLDFTGTLHVWFGWLARVQLIPAILAVNLAVVLGLLGLTLLFGRIYCSTLCPLGVLQDGISNVSGRRKGQRNRFRFVPALPWLRYAVFGVFVVAFVVGHKVAWGGFNAVVSMLDPYSIYGRIAANLFNPLYRWGNNLLALIAEQVDSYLFYATDVWLKSSLSLGVAAASLLIIAAIAWRSGRTYCNAFCPVGTLLGFISRRSVFKIKIDEAKCTGCKRCERQCKASCIDSASKRIDHSRCVVCFNCVSACKFGGVRFALCTKKKAAQQPPAAGQAVQVDPIDELLPAADQIVEPQAEPVAGQTIDSAAGEGTGGSVSKGISRREAMFGLPILVLGSTLPAPLLQVDGGLADIEDKQTPKRQTRIVPPGAQGITHFTRHCSACHLCITACPNSILRPSSNLTALMQPEMSFERGYCRPECTKCSQVCPTGAIKRITAAEKSSIAIGLAIWSAERCIVNRDNVTCRSCERHCPTGAITRVNRDPNDPESLKIPTVDRELCIGCGACEYRCPSRPLSAIIVEGNAWHHRI